MIPVGPAARWAAAQQPGTRLRWKQLELAAYADHPAVRDAITGRARPTLHGPELVLRLGFFFVSAVVRGLIPVLPLAGLAAAAGGRLHESGFFFAGVGLLQLAALVTALRGGRDHPLVRWWSRYTTVTGGLTLVLVLVKRDGVDDWVRYAIPVIVTVAAALITQLLTFGVEPAAPVRARGAARARVAELTGAEREVVSADLEAALDDLAARGVISAAVRDKVRDAPLGLLTVTLNAPRKRKPVG